MIDHAALTEMMSHYGLWVLTPLAVIEGPIVTVVAGYLASLSVISLAWVVPCLVLADVVGDVMFYLLGRYTVGRLSPAWGERFGVSRRRVFGLMRGFRRNGTGILVAAKLTHAAGFAALTAAGAAHMRFSTFVWVNTLASIPKTLFFLALGYLFGNAYATIERWLSPWAMLALALVLVAIAAAYFQFRRTGP